MVLFQKLAGPSEFVLTIWYFPMKAMTFVLEGQMKAINKDGRCCRSSDTYIKACHMLTFADLGDIEDFTIQGNCKIYGLELTD